jgi:hypothetical protein
MAQTKKASKRTIEQIKTIVALREQVYRAEDELARVARALDRLADDMLEEHMAADDIVDTPEDLAD